MTKDEALKLALEALEETRNALAWFYDSYPQDVTKKGNDLLPHVETVLAAIREALTEQPAQQQEPVQTTPNFAQLKQILDNLDRIHHMDSKQEFLRTWIRDWTEHKLAKAQPERPAVQGEPVAWTPIINGIRCRPIDNPFIADELRKKGAILEPLYTTHDVPERKPLTDEEIRKADHHRVDGAYDYSFKQGVRWAEHKHGITGEQS